jgi:hypothetical protein
MANPNTPIVNAGIKYVNGLEIQKIDNKIINMSSGAARDSTNTNDIILNLPIIINGSLVGANGVDSEPLVNNQFYAVYIIGDSTNYLPVAGLLSTNNLQPNLPDNYDMYRRVGWVLTDDSSNILNFKQFGKNEIKNYYYDIGIVILISGSSTTFINLDLSPAVPPIDTQVLFLCSYVPALASSQLEFQIPGTVAGNGVFQFGYGVAGGLSQQGMITVPCRVNLNVASVLYKVFVGDFVRITVAGYTDYIE